MEDFEFDTIGDHDEVNYDPYAGCDLYDYEAEASWDEGGDYLLDYFEGE